MVEAVGTAPGKIILFGEHAVVYGQPAIAAPLPAVCARAVARPAAPGAGLRIIAANLGRTIAVSPEPKENDHALVVAARLLLDRLDALVPDCQITLSSTIPIASGLGSGAAATTALLRALSRAMGCDLDLETLNELVYEVEKLYHGTPSGIDNTVIVYGRPVYFVKGQPVETFRVGAPLHLVVADSGVASPTYVAVGDVRALYEQNPDAVGRIFARIGAIARTAREAIGQGDAEALGGLMRENHALLRELTVSSPLLDDLASAAEQAGAYGAKVSGGGRGGNLIALAPPEAAPAVARALEAAGVKRAIQTILA